MNEQLDVLDLIKLAINEFVEKEKFLLENNLNERTITHKLANCIEKYFSNYDVDCEYNRMSTGEFKIFKAKALHIPDNFNSRAKNVSVYPDIIVHKRLRNKENILIVEVKKSSYAKKNIKKISLTQKEFDIEKIKAYMDKEQLNYKYGFYLEFKDGEINYDGEFYFSKNGEIKSIKFKN